MNPPRQNFVVRKQVQHQLVRSINIRRFTGKRSPTKRPAPFAKQRTNVGRDKSRKIVRVLHTLLESESADVISVIEGDRSQLLQREHAFDMLGDRFERTLAIGLWIARTQLGRLRHIKSLRNITA